MKIRLPKNKWLFIFATNLVWWSLPYGIAYEMSKNLSAYAPDPMADSLGIFIIPLFALWFVLWIGLNVVLFWKAKSYPAGASILVWNSDAKFSSWFWTVLCVLFVFFYVLNIFDQIQFDRSNHILSLGIYAPLVAYILFSFFIRSLMIKPKAN